MKRIILILPLVLITALALMGVGYGLWFENLDLTGTVNTGTVDGELYLIGCFDSEPGDGGWESGETWKNVATAYGEVDSNDPHLGHITINNGYPLYAADCTVKYKSTGSVPVHVEQFIFDSSVPNGPTGCTVTSTLNPGGGGQLVADCNEMTVTFIDGLCSQLHQGDQKSGNLMIKVKQDALQDHAYNFDFSIQLNQYNESSCP